MEKFIIGTALWIIVSAILATVYTFFSSIGAQFLGAILVGAVIVSVTIAAGFSVLEDVFA